MTKKRRRSRPRSSGNSRASSTAVAPKRQAPAPVPRGPFSRRAVDGPFPPIPTSLVRGFVAVGAATGALAAAFLLELALWTGLVALGLEGPPGRLVNLLALPPISTYFDALNGVTIYGLGGPGFLAAAVLVVVRAVILSLLSGVVVQLVEGRPPVPGLRRGLRAIPATLLAGVMTLSAMILGSVVLPVLGAGLGFLGSILTLVGAMFFLVNVPIVAVRLDLPASETIRRSARAALLPGSRHLLLCVLYVFLTLPILIAAAPGGNVLGVNPSIGMWIFALVSTYLHLGFLATFAVRWIGGEDAVPATPLRLRRR